MAQVAAVEANGDRREYLPPFAAGDPINPQWAGQEATAFPDNWTIGLSFFHNVFAREHNAFVDEFRRAGRAHTRRRLRAAQSGAPRRCRPLSGRHAGSSCSRSRASLSPRRSRRSTRPSGRRSCCTTSRCYRGMNANWGGLLDRDDAVSAALDHIVVRNFGTSDNANRATQWYSVFASGPGIFGLGSHVYPDAFAAMRRTPDLWSSPTRITSTAASITSARRSTSRKSSSRCIGCTRSCRT